MRNKLIYILIALFGFISCKKEFTERSSLSGTTIDNYYNTADEIRGGTSTLYSGLPWQGFKSRGMDGIGDIMGGNSRTGDANFAGFLNFSLAATSTFVADAWKSFYKVGGWSGALISAFELKKTLGGDAALLDAAIAECHFMRGVAYFYIARAWGNAPIIDDPGAIALSGEYNIPRYTKEDVFQYAINELTLAEEGLPETDDPGRVTTYSAKGMLAKLYLYLGRYEDAATKAGEVISSGQYSLVDDYQGMFNSSAYNNNSETLFAVQHQAAQNPWGTGNQLQADRGPGNLSTDVSNMWELFIPTFDVLTIWEPGDKRRAGSVMEHGWSMSQWKPQNANANYNAFMTNGYVYDTLQPTDAGGTLNETRSNIAKYVVGPGAPYGGEFVAGMNTGQNFMFLRYADVLLIYAEAVVANNASTGDGAAVEAFNKVRRRAIPGVVEATTITKDDILLERRREFAFEGDYWFDIQRQGFAKAKQIIEAQNRGTVGNPLYVTFTEQYMYLPVPASEILQDPELANPPVPYFN